MSKNIYNSETNTKMQEAFAKARGTFKYFWREMSWEANRIVPALDLAIVKVEFRQDDLPTGAEIEFMWIGDIDFDGVTVKGVLMNEPHVLTNVKAGDVVKIPVEEICDWMFATRGKAYGGFTIHAVRDTLSESEKTEHDNAWGLDFGDSNNILVAYEQEENPENLIEHPMSANMKDGLVKFLQEQPKNITSNDSFGYTMLHRQAIAGNKACVEVLIEAGADINAKTNNGHTALDFAQKLGWEHIVPILSREGK
ncbi:MAG: DUF2314 domain-containing protein [Oscillospiraceae bacterium]|nr:DUF2314 domain-containing protein [Oscillospiraceae bacterium]